MPLRQADAGALAQPLRQKEPKQRMIVGPELRPEPPLFVSRQLANSLRRFGKLEFAPWELVQVERDAPHALCAAQNATQRLRDLAVDGRVGDEFPGALAVWAAHNFLSRAAAHGVRDGGRVDIH